MSIWLGPGVTRPYPGYTVALGGLCCLTSALALWRHRPSSRAMFTYQATLALGLWLVLVSQFSVDKFRSMQTLASWLAGLGVFLLAAISPSSLNLWLGLILGLVLTANMASLYGLITSTGLLSSTFSNADTFCVIPLLGFFLSMILLQHSTKRLVLLGGLSQVVLGLAVIRTGSRAGILGLAVGLVVFVLVQTRQADKKHTRKGLQKALGLVLLMVVIALITGFASGLAGRISELKQGQDNQGVSMREDVLTHGVKASFSNPVFGSGPGTFSLIYQQFRPRNVLPDYIYVNVAHNDYVELAVEIGWPGFFLMFVFLGLIVLRAVRLIRHNLAPWEAGCLLGAVFSVLGFALFNFTVSVPCLVFWEMLLLGLLQGIPIGPGGKPGQSPSKLVLVALLVVSGCWCIFVGIIAERANGNVVEAQRLLDALRWEEALPILDRAVALQPTNMSHLLSRGKLKSQLEKFQHKDLAAEQDLLAAVNLSPKDIRGLRSLLNYYQFTRQYSKAEKINLDLQKAAPYLEGLDKQLCKLQLLQNKYEDAASTLYHGSVTEEETQKMLLPILCSLEQTHPGRAVSLLGQWSAGEKDTHYAVRLARQTARSCLADQKSQAADRLLNFIVEQYPADYESQYLASLAATQQGETKRAEELLNDLLSRKPTKPKDQAYYDLALSQWALLQQDFGKAGITHNRLEARLKERPRSVAIGLLLSESFLRQRKAESAAELVSRGLDLKPDEPHLLARMGTCMLAQGLPDLAQGYFEQALKLEPSLQEAKLGKTRKSIAWSKQPRDLPPDLDSAFFD
ncbi:O-antigen ligase family protein [bacterium]|nr:O-antigen ligase family protein [bacterium]